MNVNELKRLKLQVITVRYIFIGLLALLIPKLSSAYITVGPESDATCDYHDLTMAMMSVSEKSSAVIRIVGQRSGYEVEGNVLLLNRNIHLHGGFESCDSSVSHHRNPAVIRAGTSGFPNINVIGSDSEYEAKLTLTHVIVTGGEDDRGAGVKVTGHAHLLLQSAVITDNTASIEGGGVHLNQGRLTMHHGSQIIDNISIKKGGGIYCENGGEIILHSGEVSENSAQNDSGVLLDQCQLHRFRSTESNHRVAWNERF
jgi:predicted outer membrane repeat protein